MILIPIVPLWKQKGWPRRSASCLPCRWILETVCAVDMGDEAVCPPDTLPCSLLPCPCLSVHPLFILGMLIVTLKHFTHNRRQIALHFCVSHPVYLYEWSEFSLRQLFIQPAKHLSHANQSDNYILKKKHTQYSSVVTQCPDVYVTEKYWGSYTEEAHVVHLIHSLWAIYTVYWSLMYAILLMIIFISSNTLLLLNARGLQGLFCNPGVQYLAHTTS